jgi:hypothetical protein
MRKIDTLKEVMVVSETASQDGLNWGVNGIIINQIGRFLGMPNTYDVVKGISRLGYYDVMDFAGYNAGNGFFSSASKCLGKSLYGLGKSARGVPKEGSSLTFDLAAAGTGLGTEILKNSFKCFGIFLIEIGSALGMKKVLLKYCCLMPIQKTLFN